MQVSNPAAVREVVALGNALMAAIREHFGEPVADLALPLVTGATGIAIASALTSEGDDT